ncbi:ribonuclease H-like domain-containing protein [Tanacetum coccineum]
MESQSGLPQTESCTKNFLYSNPRDYICGAEKWSNILLHLIMPLVVIVYGDALAIAISQYRNLKDEHLLKFLGIKDAKDLMGSQSRPEHTTSTNEAVNTAHEVSTTSSQGQASSSTYADDVMFSFFVNQSNSPQLDNEDLEQIDTDDLEDMDLKWQVAMLTMRVKRLLKKTGRNLNFNGKETVGFDKTKVECYNCHKRGHFVRECRAPRNQGNRNGDALKRIVPVETPTNALVVQDRIGLESLEARIVIHEKNEVVYEEDIAFLNDKTKPMFKDSDFDVLDDAMENVEGGSTAEQITTVGDTLNTTSINVSAAGSSTSTAGDIFEDEMKTIADTLVAIRSARPRTTLVVIRNVE